jgi:hypothetical protein
VTRKKPKPTPPRRAALPEHPATAADPVRAEAIDWLITARAFVERLWHDAAEMRDELDDPRSPLRRVFVKEEFQELLAQLETAANAFPAVRVLPTVPPMFPDPVGIVRRAGV